MIDFLEVSDGSRQLQTTARGSAVVVGTSDSLFQPGAGAVARPAEAPTPGIVVGVLCGDPRLRHLMIALLGTMSQVEDIVPVGQLGDQRAGLDVLITTPGQRRQVSHDPRLPVILVVTEDDESPAGVDPVVDERVALVSAESMSIDVLRRLLAAAMTGPEAERRLSVQLKPTSDWHRGIGASRALTARETDAMVLMARGLSNEQIASRLGISLHGVKRLVSSLMLKLGATNRTSAVMEAIERGLIILPWLMRYRR